MNYEHVPAIFQPINLHTRSLSEGPSFRKLSAASMSPEEKLWLCEEIAGVHNFLGHEKLGCTKAARIYGLSKNRVTVWFNQRYLKNKAFHACSGAPTLITAEDAAEIKVSLQKGRAERRPVSSSAFTELVMEKVRTTAKKRGHEPRKSIHNKTLETYRVAYGVRDTILYLFACP